MKYTDEELLTAIQGGDLNERNAAFKQLYMDQTINFKVKDYTSMYGRASVDADDILQEGIILLDDLIRSGKFQAKSKVSTYLIGICRNIARAGRKKASRVVLRDQWNPNEEKDLAESPEELVIVEEKSDQEQQRDDILQQLLSQLTDKCKKVLNLYYFLSYNMAQIAESQGLKNAHQAKKAAQRCRDSLRNKIQKQPSLSQFLKASL
jgi:RNA polymerase sigma factor (sigma-70 family)